MPTTMPRASLYRLRKAGGLCPGCGERPDRPERVYCDRCIRAIADARAQRQLRQREADRLAE